MLYWIVDANDMQYVDCTYARTEKVSIEHTSVRLTHAHPMKVTSHTS